MVTSSLDEREIQLLLVALRYWRAHRSEGITRRNDPLLTPDLVDLLITKLTTLLPATQRDPRQRPLFNEESRSGSADMPAAGGPPSKPPTRR